MRTYYALLLTMLLTFGVGVRTDDSSINHVTRSICGEDTILRCWATFKPGVQYQSVIWYKVSEAPSNQLTGLVIKRFIHHKNTVQRYKNVERDLELLADSHGLVLPNVTLQDAGRYRCFLSAPVGHKNQMEDIHLRVYEGPKEDTDTSKEQDTFYVVLAITLLIVALLMLYSSYTCLKNTLLSHKNKSSEESSKKINQMKNSILKIESKGIVCTLLPQEYVTLQSLCPYS